MSKNLTRKGLAFGAAVALGSTLIAGSPAFAAAGINLSDLNAKGNYGMLAGETFTLAASANSDFNSSNVGQLRVQIKNVDGVAASGFAIALGTGDAATITNLNDIDNLSTAGTTDAAAGLTTTVGDTAVFGIGATSVADATVGGASEMVSPFKFSFTAGAVTAKTTARYEVTVWADSDNDGAIDTDTTNGNTAELASSTRTVTFYNVADLATTVTIDNAVEGSAAVGADVTITGVAADQLTASEWGVLYSTGQDVAIGTGVVVDAVALSTDKTKFESDLTLVTNTLVKDTAVKAQLQYKNGGITAAVSLAAAVTAAHVNVGTAATKSVVARTISTFKAGTVRSATAAAGTYSATGSADVALNSSFQVSATAENTTTTPAKPVVGAAVTAKIEVAGVTLSSTKTVTVNGVTYSDATKLPGYNSDAVAKISAGSTDAKGSVTLSITTVGFAATDDVIVTFYAENFTAAVTANAADSVFSAYLTNAVDAVSTTDGVAAKLDFIVRDQFGNKPANATYEISTDGFANGQTTAGTEASEGYVAVVDGAASLSILDNGTGTGVNTYDIYLGKRASNGTLALTQIRNDFRVQIVAAADLVAGTILEATAALDADTGVYTEEVLTTAADLALVDFVTYDSRSAVVAGPTAPATAVGATIAGTVTTKASATAAAIAVDGTAVTISGAGLQFVSTVAAVVANGANASAGDVAAQKVYGIGSLTVNTDNSGAYSFTVLSNKSGKQTVTLTSGAATRTVIINAFDAAVATTGTSLVLTAPATMLPGRTLEVSGLLTDKYGNAVAVPTTDDVSIAYDGPGLVVGSLPTVFDAYGAFKFRVLLGANEAGSAIVTVKYDQNSDGDFTGTTGSDIDLVKTATITIAAAPVVAPATASAAGIKGFVATTVRNASGKAVTVIVNGRVLTPRAPNSAAQLFRFRAKAGKATVVVQVDGVTVSSRTVTVK